ncbi:hypothetical protein [Lactobacillus psittaci]|uniref:Uncharacterized protein n=1 Tax=Lactobacillus psittaci DSM 15354 TaxID=1122152 RepID=A0A0R1S0W0_9LACO|nr:hypothetical protein [Lactobacillus psittaci]KRL62783.1 hypothetical protein FC23_GL001254 [Lactobacillus psittaci DSM 15354]
MNFSGLIIYFLAILLVAFTQYKIMQTEVKHVSRARKQRYYRKHGYGFSLLAVICLASFIYLSVRFGWHEMYYTFLTVPAALVFALIFLGYFKKRVKVSAQIKNQK